MRKFVNSNLKLVILLLKQSILQQMESKLNSLTINYNKVKMKYSVKSSELEKYEKIWDVKTKYMSNKEKNLKGKN